MVLAYGKFDPDLNPPPFSNWSKAMSAVEIDLFQYYSWKMSVTSYFDSWVKRKSIKLIPRIGIRTQRMAEEYEDAIGLWNEAHRDETAYFLIHSGRKEWMPDAVMKELRKLPRNEKYFFEWGQADSKSSTSFLETLDCFQGWVIDPDWHHASLRSIEAVSLNFKLHGWNEERWTRRYGAVQVARILRTLKKYEHSCLTLSYSGKVAEATLFAHF